MKLNQVPIVALAVAVFASVSFFAAPAEASYGGGNVWAWGNNSMGQLGVAPSSPIPAPEVVAGVKHVVSVAAGYDFTLALTASGRVWAWGDESNGRLGNGHTGYTPSPSPIRIPNLVNVTHIAAGFDHALAVDKSGHVWAWGYDAGGDLGRSVSTQCGCLASPERVPGLDHVVQVAVGGGFSECRDCESDFSAALRADGTVWVWGENGEGELGRPPSTTFSSTSPLRVTGLPHIVAIATGAAHLLALTKTGRVWAWGDDSYGQLGNGEYCGPYDCVQAKPAEVRKPIGAKKIAAGGNNSAAITGHGTVWMWGDNGSGELGDGAGCSVTYENCASNRAVWVIGLRHAIGVAVGVDHVVALRSDHSVWCWGDNILDALGRPSPPTSSTRPMTPGTNQDESEQLSAGYGFSIVIRHVP